MQEVVSKKDQPRLRVSPEKFEPQLDFVPAAALAAAFQQSETFARTRELLDTPFDKRSSHPAALLKSKYVAHFLCACTRNTPVVGGHIV